jgi:hypothetical protein
MVANIVPDVQKLKVSESEPTVKAGGATGKLVRTT